MVDGILLFGPTFATMNCHLLLHLTDQVARFGPLWVNWAFPLESTIGYFGRNIHSTKKFSVGYIRAYQITKAVGDYKIGEQNEESSIQQQEIKKMYIPRDFKSKIFIRPFNPSRSRDDSGILFLVDSVEEIGRVLSVVKMPIHASLIALNPRATEEYLRKVQESSQEVSHKFLKGVFH